MACHNPFTPSPNRVPTYRAVVALLTISASAEAGIVYYENPDPGEGGHFSWRLQEEGQAQGPLNWLDIMQPATSQHGLGSGTSVGQLFWNDDEFNVTAAGAEVGLVQEFFRTRAFRLWEDISDSDFDTFAAHALIDGNGELASDFEDGKLAYMGVRTSAGNFGWIAVIRTHRAFSALGWAYETIPGRPILAGQIPTPAGLALLALATPVLGFRQRPRKA